MKVDFHLFYNKFLFLYGYEKGDLHFFSLYTIKIHILNQKEVDLHRHSSSYNFYHHIFPRSS